MICLIPKIPFQRQESEVFFLQLKNLVLEKYLAFTAWVQSFSYSAAKAHPSLHKRTKLMSSNRLSLKPPHNLEQHTNSVYNWACKIQLRRMFTIICVCQVSDESVKEKSKSSKIFAVHAKETSTPTTSRKSVKRIIVNCIEKITSRNLMGRFGSSHNYQTRNISWLRSEA